MPTYKDLTNKSIQENFEAFHADNPDVYNLLREQCLRAIEYGRKKFSIKQIIGWIRWTVYMDTTDEAAGRKFKINDAYTSRYARLFVKEFPQYENRIELRDLRA